MHLQIPIVFFTHKSSLIIIKRYTNDTYWLSLLVGMFAYLSNFTASFQTGFMVSNFFQHELTKLVVSRERLGIEFSHFFSFHHFISMMDENSGTPINGLFLSDAYQKSVSSSTLLKKPALPYCPRVFESGVWTHARILRYLSIKQWAVSLWAMWSMWPNPTSAQFTFKCSQKDDLTQD